MVSLPTPPVLNPSFLAPGVITSTFTEVVDLSTAAANHPLKNSLPAGAIVIGTALSVPGPITATTATKIGVGRLTATAAPSKYLLSTNLAAAELFRVNNEWDNGLTATEELAIFACDNAGDAAGTIGGGANNYVVVRITYLQVLKIYP